MNCTKCGRQITTSPCPYCGNQQVTMANNVQQSNTVPVNVVPPVNQNTNTMPVTNTATIPVTNTATIPVSNNVQNVNTAPVNNTVQNTNTTVNDKNNNSSKLSFLLKYLIVTAVIVLLTIIGTYLITKKAFEKVEDPNKEVYLDGYMYRMDKSLNTNVEDNRLFISNNNVKYRLIISPSNIAFDMYKDNLPYTKNLYIQKGYSVNEPVSKTINGVDYLTMELLKNNYNQLLAITRSSNNKTSYVMVIENDSNTIDYSIYLILLRIQNMSLFLIERYLQKIDC